jgi:hypothetical protein
MIDITTETVDALELDLMVARKTREVAAYLVPCGSDYTAALATSDALIARLGRRGVKAKAVGTARADNGLALLLEEGTTALCGGVDGSPRAARTGIGSTRVYCHGVRRRPRHARRGRCPSSSPRRAGPAPDCYPS